MKKQEMQRLLALVGRLTRAQRLELVEGLKAQSNAEASVEVLESAGSQARACPHCKSQRLVRNGMADGLQRYKCRVCSKTFNALTGARCRAYVTRTSGWSRPEPWPMGCRCIGRPSSLALRRARRFAGGTAS
jgi:DNA-directed RNA polymerase subunit RPC12/RpoP